MFDWVNEFMVESYECRPDLAMPIIVASNRRVRAVLTVGKVLRQPQVHRHRLVHRRPQQLLRVGDVPLVALQLSRAQRRVEGRCDAQVLGLVAHLRRRAAGHGQRARERQQLESAVHARQSSHHIPLYVNCSRARPNRPLRGESGGRDS